MTSPIHVEALPGFAPVVLAVDLPAVLGQVQTPPEVAALLRPEIGRAHV